MDEGQEPQALEAESADKCEVSRPKVELAMKLPLPLPRLDAKTVESSQLEAALRASEEFNQILMEAIPCGVLRLSKEGVVVGANTIARRILDLSGHNRPRHEVTDLKGKILCEDGTPCDSNNDPISRCLMTQEVQPTTIVGIRQIDGQITWANLTAVPLAPGGSGDMTGALVTLLDITEPKRVREALHECEQKCRSLYSSMSEGVALYEIIYDQSGLPVDYIILDMNPAYEVILGLNRDRAVGKKASAVYGIPKPPCLEIYAKVAASGQPISFQTAFEPLQKSLRISVFSTTRGKFATVVEDITERLQLEVQLVQAQRLESIGRLAGGVAHDFNNLLTAINGYSQSLLSQLPAATPMREKLEQIKKAGERSASLTHQLLAFSRKQLLQPRVLDLNALVANVDKMLRRLIREDVELVTVFGPKLGRVKADPTQLEQVLVNLVVNARDAMVEGGKIVIETANVALDAAYALRHVAVTPGHYIMLAVTDTGRGIDPVILKHIFEPFYTTKEPGKGTGLGLSTVYGIVKQSGGNIWVYTEVGHGTTFKIYLPRVEEPIDVAKPEPEPGPTLGGTETVLLVEDEDLVRNFVSTVLREKGYRVLEAHHGTEALRIAIQHAGPIQLLLTDLVMPQMSGKMLAQKLASLRPGIRVLLMSGYSENVSLHQGTLEKGIPFIEKPFSVDNLARKVREVLETRSKP
jgi:signal transduction histidine kinase